jgi:conjugal transfer pilus assembly protein TraF
MKIESNIFCGLKNRSQLCKLIIFVLISICSSSALANNKFFDERYRGWMWFEEREQISEEKLKKLHTPTAQEANIAIASRKKDLDDARNIMLETGYRPEATKQEFLEAVENYRDLEQKMQFMALKVGMAWDETNMLNPEYIDELNSPTNMYGRKKKEELDNIENEAILRQLAATSELFLFRQDGCGYCHDMEKHLARFAKKYGFKVEAVSPDGSDSPYFNTTHSEELILALDLKEVPTVFLVADDDNHRYQIAAGLLSIEGLERNALQAASLLKQGISKSKKQVNSDD